MRIGYGFDIHSFGGIKPLIIGGVTIPYKKGLIAYSNGDLLIHALIDALLGAVAIGDIGTFFPSDNILYKDIDSRVLLKNVWSKIRIMEYVICNIDITIIAESPKMSSYISYMKTNLGSDLNTQENKISIKSTTSKQISAIGRKEGIACQAIVMLLKNL